VRGVQTVNCKFTAPNSVVKGTAPNTIDVSVDMITSGANPAKGAGMCVGDAPSVKLA
jgi:hypothetical protein